MHAKGEMGEIWHTIRDCVGLVPCPRTPGRTLNLSGDSLLLRLTKFLNHQNITVCSSGRWIHGKSPTHPRTPITPHMSALRLKSGQLAYRGDSALPSAFPRSNSENCAESNLNKWLGLISATAGFQSTRSASMGCTRVALSAGNKQAASATHSSNPATAENVFKS
jgi:hypothetical protein